MSTIWIFISGLLIGILIMGGITVVILRRVITTLRELKRESQMLLDTLEEENQN